MPTPEEIRDNRDKLIIVLDMVKMNIGQKYLNQAIRCFDDILESMKK